MALIKCPECGSEISDRAAACPRCGNPMTAAPAAPVSVVTEEHDTITTQATAKPYKAMQLIGAGLIGLGLFLGIAGGSAPLLLVFLVVGVILAIIGSVLAWWHHQ